MANSLQLEPVPQPASDRVLHGARRVVEVKRQLDDLCGTSRTSWIVEQLCPQLFNAAQSALDGDAFVAAVIPFIGPEAAEVPAFVPVASMIGESWKWHECTTSWRNAEELEAYLTAPERAYRTDPDASLSTYIVPLGLAVAFEGKNRVRFLRDRGVEHIPSVVALADYPAADRLEIFKVAGDQGQCTWCVLDGRWLKQLQLPAVSHMVLGPYGVPTRHCWPREWPAIGLVHEAVAEASSSYLGDPVDLHKLRVRHQAASDMHEWVNASVSGLSGVYKMRWGLVLPGFALILAASFVTERLPGTWAIGSKWGLCGLVTGLLLAWGAPLIRARRKHL